MRTTSRRGRALRVLAPVAALGLLAACGGGGGTSGSSGGGGGGGDELDLASVSAEDLEGTTIKMSRFFGDCEDTAGTETDVSKATTECETIQILTNAFNAENESGITVERLGGAQWDTYYDALNSAYAGDGAPDVAVMHGSRLTDYAQRGLVLPLDDQFEATGTEIDDAAEAARAAVSYEDTTYGVPFDLHAGLAHLNVDLFKQAGLVDAEGNPKIPTSTEEFLADAETMKAKTGKNYFGAARVKDGLTVHMWRSLVEQQGGSVIAEDGSEASVDTPEAREALEFVNTVFEKYADGNQTYDAAQSAFLSGETAMLFNGTWAVDQYDREATFDYKVTDFPTLYDEPAVWADSHMWVLPKQKEGDPAKYRAGLEFINYLYDHSGDWAIHTGHLAARTSVLESPEYQQAPQRANYFETGTTNARTVPAISNWSGAMDAMVASLDSIWFEGKSVDEGLKTADTEVNSVLSQ